MISSRLRRACLAALLPLVLLGGCATFKSVPPGTPLAQVESEFGRPNYSCPLPDGGQRVIWSGQPFGQFAWGTNVDSKGLVGEIAQLLTDQHFQVLREGTWTPEQVLCEFGPPAEKSGVGLPSSIQIVWSYRYQQSGVWNSLMHVYFGTDGERVTRFHPGPDPMYDRDRFMPFF
ncbi:hypothetical protein [Pusillimonas sp.]|uniref:hypothetical protein n=1 Tax=Pusillimonas sp. TaxID=3040095 RepID=UPI0029ADFB5C|nr:hypothetical protein [Pusillimonas sp.]MDX3895536.1 hypothetical protein [Pusillimonas sp.]